MRLSIGPHRFIFEFKVPHEEPFQVALRPHLAANHGQEHVNEATSATPSANDVYIDDWVLHGAVGASATSIIHAASHTKSGEVVAVKRLRFGLSRKIAEQEVKVYDEILASIRDNRYSTFVMQKRALLSTQWPYESTNEVYLFWKPLARLGDFHQLGMAGKWYKTPEAIKKVLFVQVTLGLSALHDAGWIHRDLKPANLGIVELGEDAMAVVIDQGHACRRKPGGCKPQVGSCGTVGFLAPELENSAVAASYDIEVDVWSLGVVAFFVFFMGRIPWSTQHNMFVPSPNAESPTLQIFRELRAGLLRQPESSIENLIGDMLEEDPRRRPSIQTVLAHPALRDVRTEVEAKLEAGKSTGQKRSQDALLGRVSER